MVPVDLESVADELYGASPEEFVERRKQRVADARSERDRALVKAIGALRRPTRSAWMVNLLARTAPEEFQRLTDLGAALGDAQRRGSGPDLRRLAKERQVTLDSLTRSAVELAATEGYSATEATRMEVSQTLQAALADPEVAELVRTGRVIQPATYGGFGPMDLGLLAAMTPVGTPAATDTPTGTGTETPTETELGVDGTRTPEMPEADREPEEDPARLSAEAAIQSAEEALEAAASAAGSAEREAEEATTRADDLADRVEELRTQLEAAEAAEREARNAARAARKGAQQLHEALRVAEADVQETRSALDRVGGAHDDS